MTTVEEEQRDALWRTNRDRLPFLRMIAREVILPLERIMMEADLAGCRELVEVGLAVEGDLIPPKDYSLEKPNPAVRGFALSVEGIELYTRLVQIEASSGTRFALSGTGPSATEALHQSVADELVEIRRIANEACPPPLSPMHGRDGFLTIDQVAEKALKLLKGEGMSVDDALGRGRN